MRSVRLLDLGAVSAIRSQTIYHAVAELAGPAAEVTLCLAQPQGPLACIGFHQDAHREIDLGYCRARALPVLRRMLGGGAVLLDPEQVFFQLIVPKDRIAELGLPYPLRERYRFLLESAANVYRELGVPAAFRPPGDLRAGERKICGTGAATIGDAFVFVGNVILDFDAVLAARILRFDDSSVRRAVAQEIAEGVSSVHRETGVKPPGELVRIKLAEAFARTLGVDLVPGLPSAGEWERAAQMDAELLSKEWLLQIRWTAGRVRKVNVHSSRSFLEVEEPSPAGPVRLTVRVEGDCVREVFFGGSLGGCSGTALGDLRAAILGAHLGCDDLIERVSAGGWADPLSELAIHAGAISAATARLAHVEAA